MIVNFFWMGELTQYQLASMLSFKNNGFEVILWANQNHDVQKYGIELKNSEDIVPLFSIKNVNQVSLHVPGQNGFYEKAALYSDIFRFNLLNQKEGIWSDCDVFCLKPVEEWVKLYESSERIFAAGHGVDDKNVTGTGVLGFKNKKDSQNILNIVQKIIEEKGNIEHEWATFGPNLIDDYVKNNNINVFDCSKFYAVNWPEWKRLFSTNQDDVNYCFDMCKDSFCIHWWNDALDHNGIKALPAKESYLGQLFSSVINYVDKEKISQRTSLLKQHKERFKR